MVAKRKSLPIDIRRQVLHEAGFKCGNPVCRHIITLDIHHIVQVSDDGANTPENLLALCPNCHALHHRGEIPVPSLRAWKMLLLSLNEGYDKKSIELLLALEKTGRLFVSGDGVLTCAALIASDLVEKKQFNVGKPIPEYAIELTQKGRKLIDEWKAGNQEGVVSA